MATADVPAVLEPLGLSNNNNKRPDGMSIFPWKQGKTLVWDYTCSDTLAWSHTNITSQEAGRSADLAEKNKLAKYDYLTRNYFFIPVAAETMGSWGKLGLQFIQELGARIKDITGEKDSASYLFQTLGMAIQRGNAASVIGTLPSHKKLEEIFLL